MILQHLAVPVVAVNQKGLIIEISSGAAELFGYQRQELLNQRFSKLILPGHRRKHLSFMRSFGSASLDNVPVNGGMTIEGYGKDGEPVPISATISKFDRAGKLIYLATLRDMRAGRLAEQELEWRAMHDPTTGLPNRAMIVRQLDGAVGKKNRGSAPTGILFINLDGFKLVNDAYGHVVGDELLQAVAARLKRVVRPGDMVGRLTGDEFLVICDDFYVPEEISSVADRILQALRDPFLLAVGEIFQSCSIGIAFSSGTETADQLLANADSAMSIAKQHGRSNWKVFDPSLDQQARRRLSVATGLRTAIARDEMHARYQPIVNSVNATTCGLELLSRWRPPGEEISPAEFIPIAERTGAITQIGEWAFDKACAMRARLVADHGSSAPYVSVNLSVRQLHDTALARRFEEIVRDHGADFPGITIEITESILMTGFETAIAIINQLAGLGFRIAIDDFGTGYSSLAQILRFPVNVIKVDRELVRNLSVDPGSRTITRAILNIARETGKSLVLEGIEDAEQRALVEEMGCNLHQGYLYSRPLAETEIGPFLRKFPPEGTLPG